MKWREQLHQAELNGGFALLVSLYLPKGFFHDLIIPELC
jgi:hypothetical protein